MEEDGGPPSPPGGELHPYCQRCGDTLPPFLTTATLRSLHASRSESDGRHPCPSCGEPAGR